MNEHKFQIALKWTAVDDPEVATRSKASFSRDHEISYEQLDPIAGSSAPQFHGNENKWNPEQLFIAALAQCHMLTFLFLAKRAEIDIRRYLDEASGVIKMDTNGIGGEFSVIKISPQIDVLCEKSLRAKTLTSIEETFSKVEKYCFIRRSVKIPVEHTISVNWL